jgi:hypothetical protein
MTTVQDVLFRLRAEFSEMPGLRLTAPQVARLCGIDRALCQTVLDTLVDAKFLSVRTNATYGCLRDDSFPGPPVAKADLGTDRRPLKAAS